MSDIIDALDVAQKIRDYTLTQSYGDTFRFELNCKESAALIDSYAAERERIARADEREKCAERAVKWYTDPVDPCYAHEYDDEWWDQSLRDAIMGGGE
jgi:hypothetical protein